MRFKSASGIIYRSRQLDEAGVKVLPRQDLQVLVQYLAPLKVLVVEVAHYPLRLCHNLQKVPFLHLRVLGAFGVPVTA